jgi:hypothetical protein
MWCALTHEKVIGQYFLDKNIITNNSFLDMLGNYVLPQHRNNNFIFQGDGAPIHFAHIICDCSNVNFPGRWIGQARPTAWPPRSSDLMLSNIFLLICVKDQVYSQRVNTLGELKAWITTATKNVT